MPRAAGSASLGEELGLFPTSHCLPPCFPHQERGLKGLLNEAKPDTGLGILLCFSPKELGRSGEWSEGTTAFSTSGF